MAMPAPASFTKKPVTVQALQVTDEASAHQAAAWAKEGGAAAVVTATGDGPWTVVISTLEGDMTASPGDWIIRGVKGEFYPCKPDIFADTYQAAS